MEKELHHCECRIKRSFFFVTLFSFFFCSEALSRPDTVTVYGDISGEGNLNRAVQAVLDTGTLANVVFTLVPNSRYILTDSILVPAGDHITIVAPEPGTIQATAPPQILWTSRTDANTNYNFKVFGHITLKNVWLLYRNTNGQQIGSSLSIMNDSLAFDGQYGNFEGVIFDYSGYPQNSSGAVSVECKKFKGTFKNCYWKNCIDQHFRYYGRAVSYPFTTTQWHTDSITFENCTFANIGYVLMQEMGEYADYVKFNHCTFFNVVMFSMESGWWHKLSVTNCVFVNTYMYGSIPALDGDNPDGGTLRIDSLNKFDSNYVYIFPFTEQDRRILFTHSSYTIEKWLRDWMYNNPASIDWRSRGENDLVPTPQPMLSPETLRFFDSTSNGQKIFPYMNRAFLFDSTNPRFILAPSDTGAIKSFLYQKWYDCSDTAWAWKPENSLNRHWPLEENLAYTNDTLKTAGMGGFPSGDLYRWWPDVYPSWKAQEPFEDDSIHRFLNYGFDGIVSVNNQSSGIPGKFELYQNYPNPFNPTTLISYSVGTYGHTSLRVYDLLGREVATLFDGVRQPGNYGATFDGKELASGVYFVRLKAVPQDRGTPFTKTIKMLMTK